MLAISAGATFLLALAAFWTIYQNKRLRRKDYRIKLLNEINNWAKEVFWLIISNPADTTPERIKENRIRLSSSYIERIGIVSLSRIFAKEFQQVVNDAALIYEEYYCYFDEGRKSVHSIDELPQMCKDSLNNVIRAIAELRAKENL